MSRMRYGVYSHAMVMVHGNHETGHMAKTIGAPTPEFATFDEAYDAALALGGDMWIIGRAGDSEYVPAIDAEESEAQVCVGGDL